MAAIGTSAGPGLTTTHAAIAPAAQGATNGPVLIGGPTPYGWGVTVGGSSLGGGSVSGGGMSLGGSGSGGLAAAAAGPMAIGGSGSFAFGSTASLPAAAPPSTTNITVIGGGASTPTGSAVPGSAGSVAFIPGVTPTEADARREEPGANAATPASALPAATTTPAAAPAATASTAATAPARPAGGTAGGGGTRADRDPKPPTRNEPKPQPRDPRLATRNYVVKPGDTLGELARRFGTTVTRLANLNDIANPNRIAAGRTIKVPT